VPIRSAATEVGYQQAVVTRLSACERCPGFLPLRERSRSGGGRAGGDRPSHCRYWPGDQ
jgi:hypothetical protein